MPLTARIAILIFFSVLTGSVRAQTYANATIKRLPTEEINQPPDWAKQCPKPSSNPVRIAPPLPVSDGGVTQVSFDEPRPADQSAPILDSKTTAAHNKQAIPLSPLDRKSRIGLSHPLQNGSPDQSKRPTGLPSMATVAGSLGVVVGVFLLMAWLMRRAAPQRLARLPDEAFEVLGRAPLAGRQNVHLLRCGNKLLLVSVTPAGTETLTEITDPQEVDRLAGLCRQAGPHSTTAAFKRIFEQLAPKHPNRGSFSPVDYPDYDSPGIELSDAMSWEQRNA